MPKELGVEAFGREWLHPCTVHNLCRCEKVVHQDRLDLEMRVLAVSTAGTAACAWVDEKGEQLAGVFDISKLVRADHACLRWSAVLGEVTPGFDVISLS